MTDAARAAATGAAISDAIINWISGPVLRATTQKPFHLNEAVKVGHLQLLGEVFCVCGRNGGTHDHGLTGRQPGQQPVWPVKHLLHLRGINHTHNHHLGGLRQRSCMQATLGASGLQRGLLGGV